VARGAFFSNTPLARLLIARDLTLEQLAEMSGLSKQTCQYLARGGHPSRPYSWTPATLAAISRALGVHPRVLAPELYAAAGK
jgi:transcriptional regulator with XRE-family HTH domain